MAASKKEELVLDLSQVKKAALALQAFLKSKSTTDSLLLNDSHQISLLFTLWKVPKKSQIIRIPLPHGLGQDVDDVCLFTKDEPNMTTEQTQRFYKKLMEERGVQNISEIIPLKMLKTEYKPFEAKRRLLGNYSMFLSDDRVLRLLPSHLGKHFYERKKDPLSVNLLSKQLARDIQRTIQGTRITITKKGCCCMARVAHSGMTADQMVENIEATVNTVMAKLLMKGKAIKILHLKSQSSVALPIYTSNLKNLTLIEEEQTLARQARDKRHANKLKKKVTANTETTVVASEEDIPQLVPIVTPGKKAKLERLPESEDSVRRILCPNAGPPEPSRWNYFHKPIIVMVLGALMAAVGAVLFLLHSSGVTEAPHATAPACLSIGLMFVVVGLVWIPILKENLRRKVTHDILGALILLTGVFGGLVIHDLFIYAGAVIIFLSLLWWVFWFSGNIEVPPEELQDDIGLIQPKQRGISGVVRRLSDRFSNGLRNSLRKHGRANRDSPSPSRSALPQENGSTTGQPADPDVSLSVIYENTTASSSSKELVRETLSI
ncbi:ribosomal L1 domain-containing protein 1 [Aplochiton taeniatus]